MQVSHLGLTHLVLAGSVPVSLMLAHGPVLEVVDVEVGRADQGQQNVTEKN